MNAFLDHYYPALAPTPPMSFGGGRGSAERFAGSYRSTRHSYTTSEKMAAPQGDVYVTANPDGSLLVARPGAAPRRWVEVDSLLFRPVGGEPSSELLAFREDSRGRITHLLEMTESFERLPVRETATFSRALLSACVATFLMTLGSRPLLFLLRGRRAPPVLRPHALSRAAIWAARGLSLLALVFLTGLFLLMKDSRSAWLSYSWVLGFAAVLWASTFVVLALTARSGRAEGVVEGLYAILGALAVVAFAWWLNEWQVLSGPV